LPSVTAWLEKKNATLEALPRQQSIQQEVKTPPFLFRGQTTPFILFQRLHTILQKRDFAESSRQRCPPADPWNSSASGLCTALRTQLLGVFPSHRLGGVELPVLSWVSFTDFFSPGEFIVMISPLPFSPTTLAFRIPIFLYTSSIPPVRFDSRGKFYCCLSLRLCCNAFLLTPSPPYSTVWYSRGGSLTKP